MLDNPFKVFGIHSMTLYNRADFKPYGILKILGNVGFDFSGDFEDLYGGSSKYPWASEQKTLNAEISCSVKSFDDFLIEKCLGATATAAEAETAGNVGTVTNKLGTSVVAATGILATATASTAADLKSGLYVFECTGAAKLKVYCSSDVDFTKGTNAVYTSGSMEVIAELTITTGGTHAITSHGLTITGGAGTIGMTTGDTAYCWVRKVNTGSSVIVIGASTQEFNEFGVLAYSQKRANGDLMEMWAPRCIATGLPIKLDEKAWSISDFKLKMMYDDTENCIAQIRKIKG